MNTNFGISDKSYQVILEALQSFPEIEEAKVFGSRALGNYQKGSDIDLAIYGCKVSEKTALNLSALLNERLNIPYEIDVVAPAYLTNNSLNEHILRVGKSIYP